MAKKATRLSFGETLARLGAECPDVVVLDADLSKSTRTDLFAAKFPDRFFEMGIAEANMIGTGAGLGLSGKRVFVASFGCFVTGRFDQIRMSVAYSNAPVVVVGTHAGVAIGDDGHSQMGLEDLTLMRALPNMTVLQPADDLETQQVVEWLCKVHRGPAYLRLTRQAMPDVHADGYQWQPGALDVLREGTDVALLASGGVVGEVLAAASMLLEAGLSAAVVNVPTIKPLDVDGIGALAKRFGQLVTVEDHHIVGGLGSAVCEAVGQTVPVKVRRLAVESFGESGEPAEVLEKFGLSAPRIAARTREFLTGG